MSKTPDADTKSSSLRALARLTEVSRALTYAVSLDEVLDITVDCAADLLGAPRVVLMLRDDDGLLRIRAALGCDPEAVRAFREPLDETLISRLSGLLGPHAAERFLGVPLVVRGGITGLLAVLRPEERPSDERDEWLLSALADQASVALENARHDNSRSGMEGRIRDLERRGSERESALRMIGHDLRSPLSALNGYLHLMEIESYGPLNHAQRATLERLQAIAAHLQALVANVLDMGRLAAGTLELRCAPVELRPIAESAVDIARLQGRAKDVDFRVEVPADLPVLAEADRLRQVLIQLLDNGVKHAPAGSSILVSADIEEPEHEHPQDVVIRVADQGPGIPAEHAETIFEPYSQLGDGPPSDSMGLGLAIARALVHHMNGTLTLDTTVQKGATFVLRLPHAPDA